MYILPFKSKLCDIYSIFQGSYSIYVRWTGDVIVMCFYPRPRTKRARVVSPSNKGELKLFHADHGRGASLFFSSHNLSIVLLYTWYMASVHSPRRNTFFRLSHWRVTLPSEYVITEGRNLQDDPFWGSKGQRSPILGRKTVKLG